MKRAFFEIVLHSPMGPKKGNLSLVEDGGTLSGIIRILGYENSFSGGLAEGNHFSFQSNLKSPVGTVSCMVTAEVRGKLLSAIANTSKGVMHLSGVRIEANRGA